ncbi:MAG: DUF4188 domain-containing protein, partial [Candidatus Sericytochromatia bacterium]
HETYQVKEGTYENIYNNMPPHGLGKIEKLMPISGKNASMAGRKKKQTNLTVQLRHQGQPDPMGQRRFDDLRFWSTGI